MELDQAFPSISYLQKRNANIHPLNLDKLRNAFLMRETTPVYLSVAEMGMSTAGVKSNRDKETRRGSLKRIKMMTTRNIRVVRSTNTVTKDKSDCKAINSGITCNSLAFDTDGTSTPRKYGVMGEIAGSNCIGCLS